ncbi:ABC transporter substrate-binding protein [Achromobacter sp. HZ01]|uniref:Tripartite tricarboxylate transporter substrate binding protein n=1 Tax=Achromobacter pulmonis TaxID=1389932 RepID=A0A2N8KL84_9BURK|nr:MULTISPECIES: tripartite tricarboxylate transporter substrate binding protein [Achromobacter]PND34210.1 tripartite tricarboxylate transporter substrate binding protein [Achromobacter pulmonis]RAP64695.1 ABC transporter substrate-binding protein [Achromobacter sp. HZ01]
MFKQTMLALALALPVAASAAYPDKPVKIFVSNPPGGPVDVMLRVLAGKLGAAWGQPVVVENRPGASGIISTNALAKSAPDGYTLGMVVASSVTIVPFAVDSLPFDPQKDLQPISLVARTPFIFVVPTDSPLKTWEDFVRASKARSLSLGSSSIGTAFHLVWEQTARRAGIKALYVPSSSFGKTQNDLIGGQLDVALDAPSSAKGLIDGGRLRALAITSPQRFAGLPGTPTLEESGMKGYAPQPWIGLMAPAGTPADRVALIQRAVSGVLQEPEMKAQMETLGMIPIGSTPQALAATIDSDRAEMEPLIKELGIKLQ